VLNGERRRRRRRWHHHHETLARAALEAHWRRTIDG
jgi:hypothetical protein